MKKQKGYIALASILVISVVVLLIGTSTALLSVNEIQSSLSNKKGEEELSLVESCTEDALMRLNRNGAIPADIILPEGSCTVTINSQIGNTWVFTVSGSSENYNKVVQVSANRGSNVVVTSRVEQ